jgi:capsular polysaccharide biosynthesis protein
LPVFSQGRDVEIRRIGNGTYALSDVIFPIRPVTSLIAHVSRNLILPFVLNEMAVADPVRQLGPLKLFVRREFAANGRNLSNQAEVERWFVDKGYMSINPGTMSMEEQVILFSRATHIAGVEGAALTNILFAVNAVQILMMASPNTASENFFPVLAKNYPAAFHTLQGDVAAAARGKRSADFSVPLARLEAFAPLL